MKLLQVKFRIPAELAGEIALLIGPRVGPIVIETVDDDSKTRKVTHYFIKDGEPAERQRKLPPPLPPMKSYATRRMYGKGPLALMAALDKGPVTHSDLARIYQTLGLKASGCGALIQKLKARGQIKKVGDKWELV